MADSIFSSRRVVFCLQQPRSLVVGDGRDVTSGPITHFISTPFTLKDKSGNIHTKTLDIFVTKLGQYPIIIGILWFRRPSPYIFFNQNTVTFDSLFCRQNCYSTGQAITVVGADSQSDFSFCFPTPSRQAVDIFSADKFVPDPHSCSSSYHHFRPCALSSSAQAVKDYSTDKPFDCCSRPRSCLLSTSLSLSSSLLTSKSLFQSLSLSLFGKTTPVADPLRTRSRQPRSSHNFNHCINAKNNIRTMNQELSKPENQVSSPALICLQKESVELPTMNISIIGTVPFKSLV